MPIIGQFTAKALLQGNTKVAHPNDANAPFVQKNYIPIPAYFSSNRIIWPRTKPPEMIPFKGTVDKTWQTMYGMSYLKFWFYMLTEEAYPDNLNDYTKLFLLNKGYIRDPILWHGSVQYGSSATTWGGTWQFDSVEITNLKGNISQVNVQVSRQIEAQTIIDPAAYEA